MSTRSGERATPGKSVTRAVLAALALAVALSAHAERVWIVAGPSDSSAAGIAKKAEPLYRAVPDGFVIQTADCGDKQNTFMWVGATANADKPALAARLRIRQTVPDAYMRLCDVRTGSLVALRTSIIDRSIGLLPGDAANWEPGDRLSLLRPLPDGRSLVIVRYFANDPGDPFGGKRERVVLVSRTGKRVVLDNDCVNPSNAITQHGYLAFECVRGLVSDNVVHGVAVFDDSGSKRFEVRRCRAPKWAGDRVLACDFEDIDADGRLQLPGKRIAVESGKELISGGM
jgi:hypothetical protein